MTAKNSISDKSLPQNTILPASLAIYTLWCFAVVQPILHNISGESVPLLISHGLNLVDILIFLFGLAILVPGTILALTFIALFMHKFIYLSCVTFFMFLLTNLFVLICIKSIGMASWGSVNWQIQLFASIAISIFFLISYYRFPSIKKFTSLLAISSLVFIFNFIFLSDLGYLFDENKQESSLQKSYPPIIMVVLDAIPLASLLNENLEFDSTHFPNFTALAAKSNWYRFLQGTYTNTTKAIPVILTGNLEVKEAPTHELYPNNILNHLGDYYRIYSEEQMTSLANANARAKQSKSSWNIFLNDVKIVYLHLFLPPQLALSLPQIDDNWSHFD